MSRIRIQILIIKAHCFNMQNKMSYKTTISHRSAKPFFRETR